MMANLSSFYQMINWNPSMMSDWKSIGFVGFGILMIWSIVWKGIALWKAAKLGQKKWFIVLLVVNTMAILEIIYIFFVAKKREKQEQKQI